MVNYNEYIKSPEWIYGRRIKRICMDNGQCQVCKKRGTPPRYYDLNVHHITYERLGNEDIETDLITLCPDCHVFYHEVIEPAIKPVQIRLRREIYNEVKKAREEIAADIASNIEKHYSISDLNKYRVLLGKYQDVMNLCNILDGVVVFEKGIHTLATETVRKLSVIRDAKLHRLYARTGSFAETARIAGVTYATGKKCIEREISRKNAEAEKEGKKRSIDFSKLEALANRTIDKPPDLPQETRKY